MITIKIPEREFFNQDRNEFVYIKEQKITMEHSLRSVAKWESKWHRPFLSKTDKKTDEELIDYLRCMTLTKNVDPNAYYAIPQDEMNRISSYMEDPMTATTIKEDSRAKSNRSIVTAEILYYDMTALNIPFECDKWHLNRLLILIEVCSEKNKPKKKIPKRDLMNRNRSLNAARRKKLGSSG